MSHQFKINMFLPSLSKEVIPSVNKVLSNRWIGQGQTVVDFENKVKSVTQAPFTVAVNHVSSAIRLALVIAGVGPGDEVITSPQTCTATNHPILEQFADPIFADIHMLTGNLDPCDIEHRITKKTKAIMCSHWGGYPCDLEEIHQIAVNHNLSVIEDASDALGAFYKNRSIGSISPFTCFSFQAIQQITSIEGGILCTLRSDDYQAALRRRWFGIDRINRQPNKEGYYDFDVDEVGYGYHMTNVFASVGLANFKHFSVIRKLRLKTALKYRNELSKTDGVTLFNNQTDRESSFQLFSIHVERRDDFYRAMKSRGVETSIVHMRNDVYTVFGGRRKDLPHLDQFSESFVCIPIHDGLTNEQIDFVIDNIRKGW